MGEIVPFHIEPRPRAVSPPGGQAQILFFLGVRYVRHDDESGGPKSSRPGGNNPRPARRKKRA